MVRVTKSLKINPEVWKEQPGHANDAIYNLGAHLIDQAIVLFGKPKDVLGISWPIQFTRR